MRLFTLIVGTNPPTITPLYSVTGATGQALSYPLISSARVVVTEQAVTYSASMTIALASGSMAIIVATNNTAFTINAPTGTPSTGERLSVKIKNASGGALGAVTWNAIFKMSAWTQPANGFSRSITFEFDGTNWVQLSQTGVDVPN